MVIKLTLKLIRRKESAASLVSQVKLAELAFKLTILKLEIWGGIVSLKGVGVSETDAEAVTAGIGVIWNEETEEKAPVNWLWFPHWSLTVRV